MKIYESERKIYGGEEETAILFLPFESIIPS